MNKPTATVTSKLSCFQMLASPSCGIVAFNSESYSNKLSIVLLYTWEQKTHGSGNQWKMFSPRSKDEGGRTQSHFKNSTSQSSVCDATLLFFQTSHVGLTLAPFEPADARSLRMLELIHSFIKYLLNTSRMCWEPCWALRDREMKRQACHFDCANWLLRKWQENKYLQWITFACSTVCHILIKTDTKRLRNQL